ncbi:amidohydrolase family protein [Actinokineospora enzanensis]|uniref:amidohydrolase family protein n=1 Tax=Actinokineospora enzanensis TaxID=155975 RepID=UPI0006844E17|nr:amidohydrolase [Actinokineospora enzanensis]
MSLRLHAPIVLPCDPACSVVRDGVVDIDEAGRILHCGPTSTAPATDAPTRELSGILIPGLVNTHAHSPMTLLRGMGGDLPLMRWLTEVIWPAEARLDPSDVHTGMVLGSLEMLRAGVTTSAEMYFHGEELVRAALATGSRVVLAPAIIDAPGWDWRKQLAETNAWIDADGLRSGPGERIELGYGPHSAYTLPPEALTEIGAAARERNALIQIHVAESLPEDVAQRAEHGSVPALLEKAGLLGGRVLAAHSVHLSDEDIALFARREVGVAHCPGSNTKLASGIARVGDLRAAGVALGLGTDGPASNDDLDLWEDMRLAGLLGRVSTMDSTILRAADLLLLATRGGAAALSRDDIGALEPGRWADLVHIGVDDPAFAAGLDIADDHLLSNLVWAAGSRTVRDVWVAGEPVITDARPTRVPWDESLRAARAAIGRLVG